MSAGGTQAGVSKNAGIRTDEMPRFEALTRRGGRSVPKCRARTPGKGGPFPRCHYGLRRSRGASRGSAVAETLAGDTQLSRGMPARKRHAETRSWDALR